MRELAMAFKTLDEDHPRYGVIYPDMDDLIRWMLTEDEAWWAANDYNVKFTDTEAMGR